MTPLRQRMLEELERRNYSPATTRGYILAVKQFAEHFGKSPEQLGAEEVRRFQLYLLKDKKLAPGTVEIRMSALRSPLRYLGESVGPRNAPADIASVADRVWTWSADARKHSRKRYLQADQRRSRCPDGRGLRYLASTPQLWPYADRAICRVSPHA